MSLQGAIDALTPLLGAPESEPVLLEGGITNRNYRISGGGRDCVVRLPGKETALLGIDRATERDATRAATGIAPDVIAFDPRHECLVTSFIDGSPRGIHPWHALAPLRAPSPGKGAPLSGSMG